MSSQIQTDQHFAVIFVLGPVDSDIIKLSCQLKTRYKVPSQLISLNDENTIKKLFGEEYNVNDKQCLSSEVFIQKLNNNVKSIQDSSSDSLVLIKGFNQPEDVEKISCSETIKASFKGVILLDYKEIQDQEFDRFSEVARFFADQGKLWLIQCPKMEQFKAEVISLPLREFYLVVSVMMMKDEQGTMKHVERIVEKDFSNLKKLNEKDQEPTNEKVYTQNQSLEMKYEINLTMLNECEDW